MYEHRKKGVLILSQNFISFVVSEKSDNLFSNNQPLVQDIGGQEGRAGGVECEHGHMAWMKLLSTQLPQ